MNIDLAPEEYSLILDLLQDTIRPKQTKESLELERRNLVQKLTRSLDPNWAYFLWPNG
ncbi:hypothetical protein UFOVP1244_114 [uncultured Caudovirales phage]|uniref:Uncharacterized protein n=1 Tax=uncultured Caudovirales phage TaxID=2100421 RepID=A0A6J5REX9_9CAUD|nr:hypothetical protein UFOVP1244_114 [uncultured Caudovirales phage]